MRGLGLKILVVAIACNVSLLSIACDEEEKMVCCECTCYANTPDVNDVKKNISGMNIDCISKCRTHCDTVEAKLSKDPKEVKCESQEQSTK